MSGKRVKGEGSVHRLPSGSWQSQIMDGYTDEGKRHIVSFTAPSRAEALNELREYLLNKQESAGQTVPEIPLFAEYAQRWYEAYRSQVEESTYANYRYTLKLLNSAFGHLPLSDVKVTQVNQFVNELAAKGYSSSQINKCRSMLIQILDVAEADDLVVKNYARRAFRTTKQLSKEKKTHIKDSFTVEETERLLSDLPDTLLGNSIRLMLISGLRLQELLALTPRDIAEDGSWVRVDKAVKMVDGIPKLGDPKSYTSRRVIPIAPKYRGIPCWLRENGGQAFLWCAPRQESLLYSTGAVRRKYYRLLEKYPDVRRLSPHCCRHTYVTLLQRQGVPMETIARLTGHTDIKTTGNYLHISDDTLANAVTALEQLIKLSK